MIPTVTSVATLISNPRAPAITDAVLAEARRIARTRHPARTLHDAVAAEFLFDAGPEGAASIERELRSRFSDRPIDIVIQPAGHRRKRLFLADMDSTMIGQECIDELADFVGLKAEVAAITERAMRGEIAFEPALRERVALLRGLPLSVVDEVIAKRIRPTPGGAALVRTMKAHGVYTMLVSGGFTLFTGPISAAIGFDAHRSNLLLIDSGRFAGTVAEPILGREAKLATLIELRTELGLAASETLAVGDGANDLAMLGEAGLGVAYHAKPQVAASAHVRIDHGNLTALLYLQGYTRDEFVG
jgi:phosphoserine phosphatase